MTSAADPFRYRARAALLRGARELWRVPLPTAAALAGAVTAALAARAAHVRADQALHAGRPGRALLVWLVGGALAALVVDVTRAAALVAYAGPPRPPSSTWLLGLLRTPGMISVRAVELLAYFTLALGDLFVLTRGLPRIGAAPATQALLATMVLFPSLALALVLFGAARIAQTVIARGLPTAVALAHGCDVVLRRFASLSRLALAGSIAVAPLLAAALWLPFGLRAALLGLAALWLYASLATWVGRDGRLATG